VTEARPNDSENGYRSYYGRPIIREPVWSWEIPWYFFAGGLAGASSGLGFVADLAGNRRLGRTARFVSLAAASPVLLISDLGRPDRRLGHSRGRGRARDLPASRTRRRSPKYTVKHQRERLESRPPGQRRTETLGGNERAT
jgi:hypothetical protein